jgi:hypothetical protein
MLKLIQTGIPIFLALAAVIATLIFSFVHFPYWIVPSITDLVKVILLSSMVLSLAWVLRQGIQGKSLPLTVTVISLVLITGANSIFWGTLLMDRILKGVYVYRGDVELNGFHYYVDSSWKPGTGSTNLSSFWLQECDQNGLNCKTIHEEEYRHIPRAEYMAMTVRLLPDLVTNTLTLEINGEVVYTYHP